MGEDLRTDGEEEEEKPTRTPKFRGSPRFPRVHLLMLMGRMWNLGALHLSDLFCNIDDGYELVIFTNSWQEVDSDGSYSTLLTIRQVDA